MGQVASTKLSNTLFCSSPSPSKEENEEFRPHHPRFVVTAEMPNSKLASLQPRYSESNRSYRSLAKDSIVLDVVSLPSLHSPVTPASLRSCGRHFRRIGLIAACFDSVSQHPCLLPRLRLHRLPFLVPLQCRDTRSPRSTRRSSSTTSTISSKSSVRVLTDASSPQNIADLERVVRSRKSPT